MVFFYLQIFAEYEIPKNITPSFCEPLVFDVDNYSEGFKIAYQTIEANHFGDRPILFGFNGQFCEHHVHAYEKRENVPVIRYTQEKLQEIGECKCFNPKQFGQEVAVQKFKERIRETYLELNKVEPIIYLNESNQGSQEPTAEWVQKRRREDLIVDTKLISGFEHDIVVLFGSQNQSWGAQGVISLDHCMRAVVCLIIVEVPCCHKCFGQCSVGFETSDEYYQNMLSHPFD